MIPQCCIVHPYCARFFTSLARANESVHEHKERNFPQAKLNSEINARFLLNGHGSLCLFYCIIMVYILSSLIKKKFKILPERKKKDMWECTKQFVTEEKYPPKLKVGLCVIFALLNILIVMWFRTLLIINECPAASLRSTELSPRQVRPPLSLYSTAPKLLVHIRP